MYIHTKMFYPQHPIPRPTFINLLNLPHPLPKQFFHAKWRIFLFFLNTSTTSVLIIILLKRAMPSFNLNPLHPIMRCSTMQVSS